MGLNTIAVDNGRKEEKRDREMIEREGKVSRLFSFHLLYLPRALPSSLLDLLTFVSFVSVCVGGDGGTGVRLGRNPGMKRQASKSQFFSSLWCPSLWYPALQQSKA